MASANDELQFSSDFRKGMIDAKFTCAVYEVNVVLHACFYTIVKDEVLWWTVQ